MPHNPALSVRLESSDDGVILEGAAAEVNLSQEPLLKKLYAASRVKYKMPLMIIPESVIYSVRPQVVLAWTGKDFPHNRNPLAVRRALVSYGY